MDKFVVRKKRKHEDSVDEAVGQHNEEKESLVTESTDSEAIIEHIEPVQSVDAENSNASSVPKAFRNWEKQHPWLKLNTTWVDEGFLDWKHGLRGIEKHEVSTLHINCAEALANVKTANIVPSISSAKSKQMMNDRVALLKIFSTLKTLVRQGHKWLHHQSQNEILELMASTVLSKIMDEIRAVEYFLLSLDETSDVSRSEQVSICLRIVSDDLSAKKYFIGSFSTKNTSAETLFDLVKKILMRYDLPISKLRGQCYDGASNVSGKIFGLQSQIRQEEPQALFVHCNAHNPNLVVQDSVEKILFARKFIRTLKNLINFVRDSTKHIAQFKDLQIEAEKENDSSLPSLAAYCPTRWVVRIKSLKTVKENYAPLMQFFYDRSIDREVDSSISAKASGFFNYMGSFEYSLLPVEVEVLLVIVKMMT
ncbi:zinc finger MYM-type protein 1-like [Copidosoma floridanum]|uniref:zinc finger MYM-type protein 1-like n=1 Tax=Copidosoma floridanum TaxID=29053 RepID=UPI000C6FABE4|nr:zinc finger MYM-type protein 1-like [Copidosoma floridanum]